MANADGMQQLMERLVALEGALVQERDQRGQAEAALRQQMQNQQAAQTPIDRPMGSALVDTRQLGKPDKFDGRDECWKEWKFVTKSYLCAVNQGARALLDKAERTRWT